jgi:hypothetical protein
VGSHTLLSLFPKDSKDLFLAETADQASADDPAWQTRRILEQRRRFIPLKQVKAPNHQEFEPHQKLLRVKQSYFKNARAIGYAN